MFSSSTCTKLALFKPAKGRHCDMSQQIFSRANDPTMDEYMAPLLFPNDKTHLSSSPLLQHTRYGFIQMLQQSSSFLHVKRLQLLTELSSSQNRLGIIDSKCDTPLPQFDGPALHCMPQIQQPRIHPSPERTLPNPHTPPGIPPMGLDASSREASLKKRNSRAKSPILYEIVLAPGKKAKKNDWKALHQRKSEKIMGNRASANRAREKNKQLKAEKDTELASLRAKVAELESKLSILKTSSSLDVSNGPKIQNLAFLKSVKSDLDPITSVHQEDADQAEDSYTPNDMYGWVIAPEQDPEYIAFRESLGRKDKYS